MSVRIAIFASGSGSNAENIIKYFSHSKNFVFPVILSNNQDAFIHQRAKELKIPSVTVPKNEFSEGLKVLEILREYQIDCIVLAGFLLRVPQSIIDAFPNKIINIHPALLPKFGGKGMYGDKVHKAVIEAGESHSGITIHYVNENYDEGSIIFQAKCEVESTDTPESLAKKVHALEYEHFPKVIEMLWG